MDDAGGRQPAALSTAFTELVGCAAPVQLAPMGGGVVTEELAAAVCRAGGLGMLGRYGARPLPERLDRLAQAGVGPVGWARAAGSLTGWQVGSVGEARRAVDAGCDLVVVQGVEAGGHVRGTTALLPLLCEVLERVDVPVLAAGGLTTARAVAAVLVAGASGVRVGTRFLATVESGAHPEYVAALVAARGDATVLTTLFSVGWPDAPHRVLVSAAEAAAAHPTDTVGMLGGAPVPRLGAQTPNGAVTGEVAAMALYAGQGVGAVDEVLPAGEVVTRLVQGARDLLGR